MAKTHNWGGPVDTGKSRSIQINPVKGTPRMKEAFRKALIANGESVKSERGLAFAINSLIEKED